MSKARNHATALVGLRASVGVALIAKDSAHTLGRCLDSLRPYVEQIVVCVDERTTDHTRKIARSHGADVVKPIKVSDWHECPQHGKVLAQHFANARNESFSYLDRGLDWWLWIDADDVFEHGDQIKRVLASVPEQCVGVWLPYRYSTLGNGQVTSTLFHRERFLRTSLEWEWVYRVHEVVKPKVDNPGGWFGTSDMDIWHQEGQHRTEDSARRNLLLLEIDLEQAPNDTRTVFYIGNQYFAMNRNQEAAHWYRRLLELGGNEWERWQSAVYMGHALLRLGQKQEAMEAAHWYRRLLELGGNEWERWQSAVYMGHALLRLGQKQEAMEAAWLAANEHPEAPEPYYLMASIYRELNEPDKVWYWTQHGRRQPEPPFFVFKNPMDYGFNNRICLADALAADGQIPEARAEWEAAYRFYPDPRIQEAIEKCKGIEAAAKKADAYVSFATYTNGASRNLAIEEYGRLPEDVRSFGRVRDVAVPLMLARRPSTQPHIVFWCGKSWEEWAPPSLNLTGIGGSETAVVEIARRFARDGWRVDVFNGAGRFEGIYNGVGYWDPERIDPANWPDVYVSWRQPHMLPGTRGLGMEAKASLLWCHDLNYGPDPDGDFGRWDRVLGVSAWHARMLRDYYGLPEVRVGYVPNGVNLDAFAGSVERVPMRCVYASSADRGLVRLLQLWPQIRDAEPGAELHIAYGWDTLDRMIARGRPDLANFKHTVQTMIEHTPGVVWRGRLPQDTLAGLYGSAYVWAYPTDFLEVSCISAMEAMAAGCVPVTSARGALPETIGDAGLLVPGLTTSRHWQEFYVYQVLAALTDPNLRNPLSIRGKVRAAQLTWETAYKDHWVPMVEGLLAGSAEQEAVCV